MTVDVRMAALVMTWVHLYTRRLPAAVAWDRRAELISDLWEERAASRVQGRSPTMTAASLAYRALAGVPADITWRSGQRSRLATRELQPLSPHLPTAKGPGRWRRFSMLLRTRRCHACGRRYERRRWYCPTHFHCLACGEYFPRDKPYCPHCKTHKGGRGQNMPAAGSF